MFIDQIWDTGIIEPRIQKALEVQKERTKKNAEVFTPAWICNQMNNQIDKDKLDSGSSFNAEISNGWVTNQEKIKFKTPSGWKKYIRTRVLEITCGEAPFLVSRYDSSTGKTISVNDRIGFLDRKLRIAAENTKTEEEWFDWTIIALKKTYGYEFQGDSLLLGRINVFLSVLETMKTLWNKFPNFRQQEQIATIISWNLFQMDGLTDCTPIGISEDRSVQLPLFDCFEDFQDKETATPIRIAWWDSSKKYLFREMKEGKSIRNKFDVVIGNPPYQLETTDKVTINGQKSRKNIFHHFQIAADQIASNASILIYPGGRWIHRSGKGLSSFGLEQINDPHLAELIFYPSSRELFGKTVDLADGISVVLKNYNKKNR